MRTVHETEALRPSDPVPKSMQAAGAPPKHSAKQLKIIIKTPQSHAAGHDDAVDDGSNSEDVADHFTALLSEHGFSDQELEMDLQLLHRTCRSELKFAEKDSDDLKRECRVWEEVYKKAWKQKQVLVEQVLQSEISWHDRRKAVLSGAADVQVITGGAINGVGSKSLTELSVPSLTVDTVEARD
jgi:hypothetical protein